MSPELRNAPNRAKSAASGPQLQQQPLIFGFGIVGRPPNKFIPLVERKLQTAGKARLFWAFVAVRGPAEDVHSFPQEKQHQQQPNQQGKQHTIKFSKEKHIQPESHGDRQLVQLKEVPQEVESHHLINEKGSLNPSTGVSLVIKRQKRRQIQSIFGDSDFV